jgi:drug/metabolite transporter (DMT)-like permease
VNLRRGLFRLGLGLVWVWFVFWTFAYVIPSVRSENQGPPPSPFSSRTDIAAIVAALLIAPWVVTGFRQD